jgi:hypothetical protein
MVAFGVTLQKSVILHLDRSFCQKDLSFFLLSPIKSFLCQGKWFPDNRN